MDRKDILFILAVCGLVLVGEIAFVFLVGQTRPSSAATTAMAPNPFGMTARKKVTVPSPRRTGINVRRMPSTSPNRTPGTGLNEMITLPEQKVVAHFGPPTNETAGVVGISDPAVARAYRAAKTLSFAIEGGVVYAVLDKGRTEWICVASEFVPGKPLTDPFFKNNDKSVAEPTK